MISKRKLKNIIEELERKTNDFCWMFQERGVEVLNASWDYINIRLILREEIDWQLKALYRVTDDCWLLKVDIFDKGRHVVNQNHLCWPNERLIGLSTPNWALSRHYEGSMSPMKTEEFFKKLTSFNINLL